VGPNGLVVLYITNVEADFCTARPSNRLTTNTKRESLKKSRTLGGTGEPLMFKSVDGYENKTEWRERERERQYLFSRDSDIFNV
jgi:hypothetical protein